MQKFESTCKSKESSATTKENIGGERFKKIQFDHVSNAMGENLWNGLKPWHSTIKYACNWLASMCMLLI